LSTLSETMDSATVFSKAVALLLAMLFVSSLGTAYSSLSTKVSSEAALVSGRVMAWSTTIAASLDAGCCTFRVGAVVVRGTKHESSVVATSDFDSLLSTGILLALLSRESSSRAVVARRSGTSKSVGGGGGSVVGVLLLLLLSVIAETVAVPLTLLLLMLLEVVLAAAVASLKLSFLGVGNFKVPTGTLLVVVAAVARGIVGGEKFSKDELWIAVALLVLLPLFE
jgi:hypothetical protein